MSTLVVRNESADRVLLLCIWHASNPLASDGDCAWLDEAGVPVAQRSRIDALAPGNAVSLEARRELALTVLPQGTDGIAVLTESVTRFFRRRHGDDAQSGQVAAMSFSLASVDASAGLRIRVFASSAFQFSPLQEFSLAPGNAVRLSTGEQGISLRVHEAA